MAAIQVCINCGGGREGGGGGSDGDPYWTGLI